MADYDKDQFEDVCMLCRRPESKAGRMIKMPGPICICDDCMHRSVDAMNRMGYPFPGADTNSDWSNVDWNQLMRFYGMLPKERYVPTEEEIKNSKSTVYIKGNKQGGITWDDLDFRGEPDPERVAELEKERAEEAQKAASEETAEDGENEEDGENGEGKASGQKGMPNISFINLADFPAFGGIPGRQRVKKKKGDKKVKLTMNDIPAPHVLKAQLDEYVVGQEHAKKVISVGVYNHYKRIIGGGEDGVEIEKSNMLMLGPTGCGKTYLVRMLAKLLNVPLAIADATSLTEAGYIGDDIESVLSKLLAAADNDVERAETGIVYIDEIDKIAKKKNTHSRDVSGESVQQGLLKLLEGADVEVPVGAGSKNAMVPMETVNTNHILFICGGAFPGLEEVIKQRLTKSTGIGYNAELKDRFDKDKDLFAKVTVEDIRKFGMIPEFIGRLPVVYSLQPLDREALVRILQEPKNAIIKQYKKLLAMDEVDLEFTTEALEAVADKALKHETGARALRSILEEMMLDIMYEIPKDDNIGKVTITKEYIEGNGGPIIEIRTGASPVPEEKEQS